MYVVLFDLVDRADFVLHCSLPEAFGISVLFDFGASLDLSASLVPAEGALPVLGMSSDGRSVPSYTCARQVPARDVRGAEISCSENPDSRIPLFTQQRSAGLE